MTFEAPTDVDTGRIIDHQAVQAWVASLETEKPLPVTRLPARGRNVNPYDRI